MVRHHRGVVRHHISWRVDGGSIRSVVRHHDCWRIGGDDVKRTLWFVHPGVWHARLGVDYFDVTLQGSRSVENLPTLRT